MLVCYAYHRDRFHAATVAFFFLFRFDRCWPTRESPSVYSIRRVYTILLPRSKTEQCKTPTPLYQLPYLYVSRGRCRREVANVSSTPICGTSQYVGPYIARAGQLSRAGRGILCLFLAAMSCTRSQRAAVFGKTTLTACSEKPLYCVGRRNTMPQIKIEKCL